MKHIYQVILLLILLAVDACQIGDSTANRPLNEDQNTKAEFTFGNPTNPVIKVGNSTTIVLSAKVADISETITPTITSHLVDKLTLDKPCKLDHTHPSCTITVIATKVGKMDLIAKANGFKDKISSDILVVDQPTLMFGTFKDSPIKLGQSTTITLSATNDDLHGTLEPTITPSDGLRVDTPCALGPDHPTCNINVTATKAGISYLTVTANGFKSKSSSNITVVDKPTLTLSEFKDTTLKVGQSTTIELLATKEDVTEPITPTITPSGGITVDTTCTLNPGHEYCTLNVTATKAVPSYLTVSANGFQDVTSSDITIVDKPTFTFSEFTNTTLRLGQSTTIKLSATKDDIHEILEPTITPSMGLTVDTPCILRPDDATCFLTVTATKVIPSYLTVSADGFTGKSSSTITIVDRPTFTFDEFQDNPLKVGQSTKIKLSATKDDIHEILEPTITSSVGLAVDTPCILRPDDATCFLTVTATEVVNTASLTASANGFKSTPSSKIKIVDKPTLTFDPFKDSPLKLGQSTTIKLSATKEDLSEKLIPTITSSEGLTIDSSCTLEPDHPYCIVNVTATKIGTAYLIAKADGFKNTPSPDITIIDKPTLTFDQFKDSPLKLGQSTTIKLSIIKSDLISEIKPDITSSSEALTIDKSCTLIPTRPYCIMDVTATKIGSAYLIANADGLEATYSKTIRVNDIPELTFETLKDNHLKLGQSTTIKLSAAKESLIEPITVTITSDPSDRMTADKSCTLKPSQEFCTVNVKATKVGKASLIAKASGFKDATSEIEIVDSVTIDGIIVGGNITSGADASTIIAIYDNKTKLMLRNSPVQEILNSVAIGIDDKLIAVGNHGAIITSIDRGQNWIKAVDSGITTKSNLNGVAANKKGVIVAVGDLEVITSDDNGETWTKAMVPSLNSLYLNGVTATNDGSFIAVGGNGVVITSSPNGKVWTIKRNTNWSPNILRSVTVNKEGTIIAVGGYNSAGIVLSSTDNGTTWTPLTYQVKDYRLETYLFAITATPDNNFVAVGYTGAVVNSLDKGKTWTDMTNHASSYAWCYGVSAADTDSLIVAVGDNGDVVNLSPDGKFLQKLTKVSYSRLHAVVLF